jgi:hypothetical protein
MIGDDAGGPSTRLSRQLSLLVQISPAVLLALALAAAVYAFFPALVELLAVASLLVVLTTFARSFVRRRSHASPLIASREKSVRDDLRGRRTLLADAAEPLFPDFPGYLQAPWRIVGFEHGKEHSAVELEAAPASAAARIKLILSFQTDHPVVGGAYRYDEESKSWKLVAGSDPRTERGPVRRTTDIAPGDLPSLLALLLVILPVVILGAAAPVRALLVAASEGAGMPLKAWLASLPVLDLFGISIAQKHIDILGGTCGILLGLLTASSVVPWQLRLARQVKNIPSSTARSAAPGLAEFRGRARGRETILLYRTDGASGNTMQVIAPFDLEDDTGRIRVDPEGASFRPARSLQFLQRIGANIVLTRRDRSGWFGKGERRELRDGDSIYVLGSVEIAESAPADAKAGTTLVIRRSRRQVPVPLLYRLLNVRARKEQFFYFDVFFLSDLPEQRAYDWIMADLRRTSIAAFLWTAASSWLLWQAGMTGGVR